MKAGRRAFEDRNRQLGDERGAILVLVLAVVIVLGILVGALAGLAAPTFAHSTVVRNLNDTVTAADSGIEFGIDYLRVHSGQCPLGGTGTISIPPTIKASFNNRSVVLNCQTVFIPPPSTPPPPGVGYILLISTAQIGGSGSSTVESRAIIEINNSTGSPTVQSWRTCRNGEC